MSVSVAFVESLRGTSRGGIEFAICTEYGESAWKMSVDRYVQSTESRIWNRNELFKKKEEDAENHAVNEIKKKRSKETRIVIPGGWGDQP